jgi:hypothetical protein
MDVVVAAGAELAGRRTAKTSHLAWQSLGILTSMERSSVTVELAATRVSLRIRLLWRPETWDRQVVEAELGLDDAETVGFDSSRPSELVTPGP